MPARSRPPLTLNLRHQSELTMRASIYRHCDHLSRGSLLLAALAAARFGSDVHPHLVSLSAHFRGVRWGRRVGGGRDDRHIYRHWFHPLLASCAPGCRQALDRAGHPTRRRLPPSGESPEAPAGGNDPELGMQAPMAERSEQLAERRFMSWPIHLLIQSPVRRAHAS
jgi:hypothetical protein